MESGAAVVNTASVAGVRGANGLAAYVASKHAVVGLTRVAAIEHRSRGIRVVAVCPSAVDGRMMSSLDEQKGAQAQGGAPTRTSPDKAAHPNRLHDRYATPAEIADVVFYLLGPRASYVSGTTVIVDGASTA